MWDGLFGSARVRARRVSVVFGIMAEEHCLYYLRRRTAAIRFTNTEAGTWIFAPIGPDVIVRLTGSVPGSRMVEVELLTGERFAMFRVDLDDLNTAAMWASACVSQPAVRPRIAR